MKPGAVARLAWAVAGVAGTLQLTALALLFISFFSPGDPPASLELTSGTAIAFVAFLAYPLVGGLIASRRPGNPVGWLLLALSSGVGLANATYLYSVFGLFVSTEPLPGAEIAAWIDAWLWIIGLCPLAAVLLLYPSGRLPSVRWRWALYSCLVPVALAVALGIAIWDRPVRPILVGGELPLGAPRVLEAVVIPTLLLLTLVGVAALVVRFRSGSWEERQQIKWVALGSSYLLLSGVVVTALPDLLPPLIEELLSIAGFLTVPIAIAIAILRHRLYDIDSIINRTLVYGGLTAVLAFVYLSGVVGVGGLVREATGQHDNSLVIAGTTNARRGTRPTSARPHPGIYRQALLPTQV